MVRLRSVPFFRNGVSDCFCHKNFYNYLLRAGVCWRGISDGGYLLLIPFVEILLGNNLDLRLHVVMPGTAQLAASQIVAPYFGWNEPNPIDSTPGNGILVNAKLRDIKAMNDVSGGQTDPDRFIDRKFEHPGLKIFLGQRI